MFDVIKILKAASELNLHDLISYLQSFLIEYKANWMEKNFNIQALKMILFWSFKKFCTDLISDEPEKFFNSLDFVSITEKSLISIIQNDNLQANEVQGT